MIRIKIDYKIDTWNETIAYNRADKYIGARRKKQEMNIIKLFLLNVEPIKKYPIKINCTWYVKYFGSDLDNKSLKPVLDAMQQMKIIENDNITHIREINHKAVKSEKDYLIMEIEEYDE